MKKIKNEGRILGSLLQKLAPRIGAKVLLEPEWEIVGRITFKSGKHSHFRYNTLDLNPVGSSDIAKDKDYSNYFMESLGYRVVPGSKTFFSDDWAKKIQARSRTIDNAYKYAVKIGLPVIVKPNSGTQGFGVALVHTKREFYSAVRRIFRSDRLVLVQKPVVGRDYRLVVLDNEMISAYERLPLSVTGDGRSTIQTLLRKKKQVFVASSRDTQIRIDDPRIATKLKRMGFTLSSIPKKDQIIFLLDNANLSTGGDSVDVTKKVHPLFTKLAVELTRDMGLRLCGVDVMINGDISDEPSEYWILEINAAPGLDHYSRIGEEQRRIVQKLYLKVLKHLEH